MEQGIVLAHMLGLENIMLEGDSLQTIQAVQPKIVGGVAGHIFKEIQEFYHLFKLDEHTYLPATSYVVYYHHV